MKKNTGKLLIVLAVLLSVFAIVKFYGNKGRSKSFRAELVNIDPETITEATITSPEGDLSLEKKDAQWVVKTNNGDKKAVEATVKTMFSSLQSIKPSRLVARDEDKWSEYGVDSAGTRVTLNSAGKPVLDLVLGRFGVEGQRSFHTFVRLGEESDVYVANDFMKMSVYTNADDYRNNQFLRLNKDSIASVIFEYPDSAYSLVQEGGNWFVDNQPADSLQVTEYLRGLSFVTSRGFSENPMNSTQLTVRFRHLDQSEKTIAASLGSEGSWVLRSSYNADEVFVDESVFEKVFVGKGSF